MVVYISLEDEVPDVRITEPQTLWSSEMNNTYKVYSNTDISLRENPHLTEKKNAGNLLILPFLLLIQLTQNGQYNIMFW